MVNDYSWVTTEMFEEMLDRIVAKRLLTDWKNIPNISSDIREYYNNEVLDELELYAEPESGV